MRIFLLNELHDEVFLGPLLHKYLYLVRRANIYIYTYKYFFTYDTRWHLKILILSILSIYTYAWSINTYDVNYFFRGMLTRGQLEKIDVGMRGLHYFIRGRLMRE